MQRGPVGRFFHWSAASDPEILARVPHSEREKQWGYGTLVLIPALLGFVAMTYAISTLTDRVWVYVPAGLLWAAIVFLFDRFVLSTFRKSESALSDLVAPVFLARLLLAGFVGVVVAHPLVLLIFDESIEARIERDRKATVATMEAETEQRIARLDEQITEIEGRLAEREAKRNDAEERLVAEIDGIVTGRTTGIPGRGESAKAKERQLEIATAELAAERESAVTRIATLRTEITRVAASGSAERAAYVETDDYLARANALEKLSTEEPHVRLVKLFLILFFVFVDTLPIVFKGLTTAGSYDIEQRAEELVRYDEVEGRLARRRIRIPYSPIERLEPNEPEVEPPPLPDSAPESA